MPRLLRETTSIVIDGDHIQFLLPDGRALEWEAPGEADLIHQCARQGQSLSAWPHLVQRLQDLGVLVDAATLGEVSIIGPPDLGGMAASVLERLGIVKSQERDEGVPSSPPRLTLVLPRFWDAALLRGVNEDCLARGQPWLSAGTFEPGRITVGPLVVPGQTACYECYLARRLQNSSNPAALQALMAGAGGPSPASEAVIELACEAAAEFIRSGAGPIVGAVFTLSRRDLGTTLDPVRRVARCPACSRLRVRPAIEPWTHGPRGEPTSRLS